MGGLSVVLVVILAMNLPTLVTSYVAALQYRAGVVEFAANESYTKTTWSVSEAVELMMSNLRGFEVVMKTAHQEGVQIIVFPEDAITGTGIGGLNVSQVYPFLEEIPNVPLPNLVNPCIDSGYEDRPILKQLSCMARNNDIVLVANMGDKQPCNAMTIATCPPTGWYQFNTDVVFESDGTLIAKYHKVHLYDVETNIFNPGDPTSCVSFNTSFGVTFGIFTCLDILYRDPPLCLVNKGIRNFIFPTAWGSKYPFYVSTAIQQSWSWKYKANLLGANRHMPQQTAFPSTGSGAYSSGIAKRYYISGETFSVSSGYLVTSDLYDNPDMEHSPTQEGIITEVENIQVKGTGYDNTSLSLIQKPNGTLESSSTLTELGLTLKCQLDYDIKYKDPKELYALGAYIRSPSKQTNFSYAACSLLKCATDDVMTCGQSVADHKASTVFWEVELSGNFSKGSEVLANALLSNLELVNPLLMAADDNTLLIKNLNEPLLAASLVATVKV